MFEWQTNLVKYRYQLRKEQPDPHRDSHLLVKILQCKQAQGSCQLRVAAQRAVTALNQALRYPALSAEPEGMAVPDTSNHKTYIYRPHVHYVSPYTHLLILRTPRKLPLPSHLPRIPALCRHKLFTCKTNGIHIVVDWELGLDLAHAAFHESLQGLSCRLSTFSQQWPAFAKRMSVTSHMQGEACDALWLPHPNTPTFFLALNVCFPLWHVLLQP